jgi:hypothetical protein
MKSSRVHAAARGALWVSLALAWAAVASAAARQSQVVDEKVAEGIREHIDEAEDIVDSLLEWRHITSYVTPESESQRPTAPATTLVTVDRAQVGKIGELLAASMAMLPRPAQTSGPTGPKGDLRAHIEKAQEIARELLPPAAQPVGTSGGTTAMVTVDRTALKRLEIELEAAERVAPRRLMKTSR